MQDGRLRLSCVRFAQTAREYGWAEREGVEGGATASAAASGPGPDVDAAAASAARRRAGGLMRPPRV